MPPLPSDPPCRPVRFELLADAEPGLLPRVFAPFARRDLVPDQVRSQGKRMRFDRAAAGPPRA